MGQRLSRSALYDLVWSEPLKTLCARFSISDVALRKTCQRAMIPTPERGYWARKQAGKKTWTIPLPERPPAMEDEVEIGGGHGYYYQSWTDEELLGPLPAPPIFETTLESVRERIIKAIGKVTIAREVTSWHPAVARLLKNDDKLREKTLTSTYVFHWEKPQFDSPSARRKLRILNALFFATGKFHARPRPDRDAVRSSLSIHGQHVWIKLAPSKGKNDDEKLALSIIEAMAPIESFAPGRTRAERESRNALAKSLSKSCTGQKSRTARVRNAALSGAKSARRNLKKNDGSKSSPRNELSASALQNFSESASRSSLVRLRHCNRPVPSGTTSRAFVAPWRDLSKYPPNVWMPGPVGP